MRRIMINGGIWKNTEDEVLKAAVMKYGENQWPRISSLFVRKSARQCKAQWYQWLHPSIKKTEWTREEDDKLLHAAKLVPRKWRTVAPILGRSSFKCIQRYERLLDAACGKDELYDDPRKLRDGEIDPNLESKPARPDPVDMEAEEIQMVSEARARLSNTRGKKAKRKSREKQLQEARRLAFLQKRRELKAAVIYYNRNRKRKGIMDYNAEIPFEKMPPLGFYDVSCESQTVEQPNFPKTIEELEGEKRSDKEARLRKQDAASNKTQMQDATSAILQVNQLNDATRALLADYARTPKQGADPQTAQRTLAGNHDEIKMEAEKQAWLRLCPKPLLGGQADLRRNLHSVLTSLPRPKNEYQIVVQPIPEHNEEPEEKMEEDMCDRIASEKAEKEVRLQALLKKKRSKVLQRELPGPPAASLELLKNSLLRADEGKSSFVPPTLIEQADEIVRKEFLTLLQQDSLKYPTDGKGEKGKKVTKPTAKDNFALVPVIDQYEEDEFKEAGHLIKEEAQFLCTAMCHNSESLEEFVEAHNTCLNDIMHIPTRNAYGLSSVAGNMEKVAALHDELGNVRRMEKKC